MGIFFLTLVLQGITFLLLSGGLHLEGGDHLMPPDDRKGGE
jgi:hypothetical protein